MKKKEDSFKNMMTDMAKEYRASLPGKIKTLTDLIAEINKKISPDNIKHFRDEVHKIAGSAGMYGFPEISSLCKQMVISLEGWEKKSPSKKDLIVLDAFIKDIEGFAIKQEVRFVGEELKIAPLSKGEDYSLDLFIAYGDQKLLSLLEKEAKRRNLRIMAKSEPDDVIEAIKDPQLKPRTVIIGKCFSKKPKIAQKLQESFDSLEILRQFKKQKKDTLFGVILSGADLEARLLMMKEGIDYVLEEPIVVERVFEIVESGIPAYFEKPFKVMVVDDDPDICAFISSVLGAINVEVKAVTSEEVFLKTVHFFNPNLLLLDLKLRKYSGIDLLKTVRQDPLMKSLPVIIMTALREETSILEAYRAEVDDFLVKPLVKNILRSKILRFAYLQSFKETQQVRDPLTGLYSKKALLYSISRQIEHQNMASVALLRILNFKELPSEEIVSEISNHLEFVFPDIEIMARFEDDIFAIFFENIHAKEAKETMQSFIDSCPVTFKLNGKGEKKVPLSVGISMFPNDGKTAKDLIESAAGYLKKAVENGVVCTAIKLQKVKKEIFVLDDDTDICSILSFAFLKHGFRVTVKNSIGEAEEEIKKRVQAELPSLFIFDRLLPDGDGLEFYRKIKREYEKFPTVLFLSHLSTEKDIMQGLKEGAIDYIPKPFSVSILMEKALKLLKG